MIKLKLYLIIFFVFISFISINAQKKDVIVFIRVDDIFMRESPIQPQEIDEFLKVAEKYNAHIMLATIPNRLLQVETNKDALMSKQLLNYSARGHQIIQHGFNHRCEFTNSTSWEFYAPNVKGYSKEEMINKILLGKSILEAVIGKTVTTYVGPGNDNDYVLIKDEKLYRELGFKCITDQNTPFPYIKNGQGYFISLNDYAWALTDSTFNKALSEAKNDFINSADKYGYFGLLFHDHFTRKNYNNSITLRWLDEFLSWLFKNENYNVRILTIDEWMKENKS